jgi:crotonobetainyl-CoA:carnitine CoA-transferase CaiB-like acyl-CoA transferase
VEDDPVAVWAASGAMALTGRPDRPPLGPPEGLVAGLRSAAAALAAATARIGVEVRIDPLAMLGERAALAGLRRGGTVTCGEGGRLLRATDGWTAASLARPEDWDSVPAWLGVEPTWEAVAATISGLTTAAVVERGTLLDLAVAALPPEPGSAAPAVATQLADGPGHRMEDILVVDLTSLWAGPLCGALLADAGARVVKVESTGRPDGARVGPAPFFDLLNGSKESVGLDLATPDGRSRLAALVSRADVVLEASRPRALEQMGIDRQQVIEAGGPQVWLSITAHGRDGPARDRVGFGDDAAVAGGLVVWDEDGPCFCADAVADPASGLVAAGAVAQALASGGCWTVDVALSAVAASLAGPTLPVRHGVEAALPRARRAASRARRLGADTAAVLGD